MKEIPFSHIRVGENYSREDVGDITSLAKSIQEHGLQQPMVVDKDYNLVAGFRRYAALVHLGWQGPIWVKITESSNPPVVNLIENLERRNLSFYEECVAVRKLFPGCSEQEVADTIGVSRGWSRPRMKIWEFPDDIIDLIKKGAINCGKVQRILKSNNRQEAFDNIRKGKSIDSTRPGTREIQATITACLERGLLDLAQAFRYVLGDITEEEFWDLVDKET